MDTDDPRLSHIMFKIDLKRRVEERPEMRYSLDLIMGGRPVQ